MSMLAETNTWRETKANGERLDRLIAEQQITNQWLACIADLLKQQILSSVDSAEVPW